MAPELALHALGLVPEGGLVVDPMSGSGTVLRHATEQGRLAIGYDLDPLAVLMSRVWTTPVDNEQLEKVYKSVQRSALAADPGAAELPWIDGDRNTLDFIGYWFAKPQADALRCWAWAIAEHSRDGDPVEAGALDVVRIALSRIIVTKEQCASLARDTSHSRPHRVTTENSYCVHAGLDRAFKIVRGRLNSSPPKAGASVAIGDARALALKDGTADAVLTSPPYLNAIDYMRGHRLSLVWLGHRLSELRATRSSSIGSERASDPGAVVVAAVKDALGDLSGLHGRHLAMIERYVVDIVAMAGEIRRVLKPGAEATLVVGNSCLKGVFIKNSAAVSKALELTGMAFQEESVRELPSSSRYLPTAEGSSLAKRMREETVLRWAA